MTGAVVSINGNGHGGSIPTASVAPAAFSPKVQELFAANVGAVNLNIGCGRSGQEPGFINLDRVAGPGVDLVMDLETCAGNPGYFPGWPRDEYAWMERGSIDCVLASHVLEHITHIIPLMREIHRVLKPGGYLCIASPYASSDDAVEDPTHVRYFTERSWYYFDRRLYEKDGHAGSYASPVDFCFDVVAVHLVPYPEVQEAASRRAMQGDFTALDTWKRNNRNVIKEMIAILRTVPNDRG